MTIYTQASPPRFSECLPPTPGSPPCLSNFLNGRSFTLPDLLGYKPHDLQFFKLAVPEWKDNSVFKSLHQFVNGLTIVNDPAERFIKSLKDWLGSVRSETRLLDTLLTVEELRRLDRKFKRRTITKADIARVMQKIVRR